MFTDTRLIRKGPLKKIFNEANNDVFQYLYTLMTYNNFETKDWVQDTVPFLKLMREHDISLPNEYAKYKQDKMILVIIDKTKVYAL